jgi:hypothetical protein
VRHVRKVPEPDVLNLKIEHVADCPRNLAIIG